MEEKLLKLTDSHFFQLYEITFILDIWLTKTPTIKLLDCLIVELITQIKIKILMIHVDFPSIVNSLMNGAYNFPSSLNFVSHTNYFLYFSFSLVWLCDWHVICDIPPKRRILSPLSMAARKYCKGLGHFPPCDGFVRWNPRNHRKKISSIWI